MLANALAIPVANGHYDELHDQVMGSPGEAQAALAPAAHWREFFNALGPDGLADLSRRQQALEHQIRSNGVTYNVYADAKGAQRPWSLDLFPLIIAPASWQQIEVGVLQRVRLLEAVLADAYGPQQLLRQGLLPPALVQGHPGYLQALHGVQPLGGTRLHIVAFDLARGPDGLWWVTAQRTQAPSGLGYLLENRLAIARQFPRAFEAMQVQRLAGTYQALVQGLKQMSGQGDGARIALLTPGPYNETFFEHAYLARYLGLDLVQGQDLTVREQRLYRKTLHGLEPVHGLLKRLDDDFLDPLELRADSTLGVPGLLQAVRAGHVLLANAPGSAWLESPALLGFMPALAQHVLGQTLELPALPSWWCGEAAALADVLPRLRDCVLKPTYPTPSSSPAPTATLVRNLNHEQQQSWAQRLQQNSEAYTAQAYLPLSQMPTWQVQQAAERIVPRSMLLRVFAVSDGPQSWRVLPGGMARIASTHADITSMQHGGSSADVWALTRADQPVDTTTLLTPRLSASSLAQQQRTVTSRAAEQLFWLGRHTERVENALQLSRLTLDQLHSERSTSARLLDWLARLAQRSFLLPAAVNPTGLTQDALARALVDGLADTHLSGSVGTNLLHIRQNAFAVRERLSHEHWQLIVQAQEDFFRRYANRQRTHQHQSLEVLRVLDRTSSALAAITGAQLDRMSRDDGWRLLMIGRLLERLEFLAGALQQALHSTSVHEPSGFEALLALFDSTISFRTQYQQSQDLAPLLNLLVLDLDNPRSLGWICKTLRGRLARLAACASDELAPLSLQLPDPQRWQLQQLCPDDESSPTQLLELLEELGLVARAVSEDISAQYFSHAGPTRQLGL